MRASLQLLTLVVVALLAPGCFLDRSAVDAPGRDGGQPPDIDAGRVDAFVPPEEDAGPTPDSGPVCVPTGPDLCGGGDEDCDPGTLDGSGEVGIGEPCDGDDPDACVHGTMQCSGSALVCIESSDARVEVCNGVDDDCDGVIDEDAGCPCPQESYGGRSYLFCSEPARNWRDARTACPMGYDLVRIDDREEHEFVVETAAGAGATRWWLGGRAMLSSNLDLLWRWAIGGDLMPLTITLGAFSNWASGQPNSGDECLELRTNQAGSMVAGAWDDASCSDSKPYVCESVAAP
jgi:hypothetical protein